MGNKSVLPILFLLLFLISSCKKEVTPQKSEINVPNFMECYKAQHLDSTAVANSLVGSWVWRESSCMTGYQRAQMNHTISVTFTSSGTYTFIENSTVTQGNWKIQMIGMNYFGVDSTLFETVIDKPIYYLSGLVLPCGNQLMLDDSYGDGCSNLFQKQ